VADFHPLLLEWIDAGRETMRLRRELDSAQDKERRARDAYEKVFRALLAQTYESPDHDANRCPATKTA
jgi:hypothetical protein